MCMKYNAKRNPSNAFGKKNTIRPLRYSPLTNCYPCAVFFFFFSFIFLTEAEWSLACWHPHPILSPSLCFCGCAICARWTVENIEKSEILHPWGSYLFLFFIFIFIFSITHSRHLTLFFSFCISLLLTFAFIHSLTNSSLPLSITSLTNNHTTTISFTPPVSRHTTPW